MILATSLDARRGGGTDGSDGQGGHRDWQRTRSWTGLRGAAGHEWAPLWSSTTSPKTSPRRPQITIRVAGRQGDRGAAAVGSTETADLLVAEACSEFGRLDILVTNAGILRDKVLWKMTDEDFDLVTERPSARHFHLRARRRVRMREQGEGGRLILVGSPAGQRGNFGQTNYAAAKAGIVAFARTWSMELARNNITVNAVVPVAATAMTSTVPFPKAFVEALERGEPLPAYARRELAFGAPEDVAGLVPFLASDAAAGITGQAIGIGGDRLSLWSHPEQIVAAYRDGGWGEDTIADDLGRPGSARAADRR